MRRGASAVAVGEGAVWVVGEPRRQGRPDRPATNPGRGGDRRRPLPGRHRRRRGRRLGRERDDGTVSRIDPESNEVVETNRSRRHVPAGIVLRGRIGLGDESGGRRPDASGRAAPTASASASGARRDFETDPHANPEPQLAYFTCAKLLNYPDAPAPAGHAARARGRGGAARPLGRRPDVHVHDPEGLRVLAAAPRAGDGADVQAHDRAQPPPKLGGHASTRPHRRPGLVSTGQGGAHLRSRRGRRPALDHAGSRPASATSSPGSRTPAGFYCAVPLNTPRRPARRPAHPVRRPVLRRGTSPTASSCSSGTRTTMARGPRRLRQIHVHGSAARSALGVATSRRARRTTRARSRLSGRAERQLAARYGPASAAARDGRQRYFVNPALALGVPRC